MTVMEDRLGKEVTKSWNEEKGYFLVKLPESSRETVDIYINTVLKMFDTWDNSKPIYTIQDISGGDVMLTPYLRERLSEISKSIEHNHLEAYVALVMEENFTGQVMRTFGRILTMRSKFLHQMFFTDMKQAENWIAEQQNA